MVFELFIIEFIHGLLSFPSAIKRISKISFSMGVCFDQIFNFFNFIKRFLLDFRLTTFSGFEFLLNLVSCFNWEYLYDCSIDFKVDRWVRLEFGIFLEDIHLVASAVLN